MKTLIENSIIDHIIYEELYSFLDKHLIGESYRGSNYYDDEDDVLKFSSDVEGVQKLKGYGCYILDYVNSQQSSIILTNGELVGVDSHESIDGYTNIFELGAIRISPATRAVTIYKKPTAEQYKELDYAMRKVFNDRKYDVELYFSRFYNDDRVRNLYKSLRDVKNDVLEANDKMMKAEYEKLLKYLKDMTFKIFSYSSFSFGGMSGKIKEKIEEWERSFSKIGNLEETVNDFLKRYSSLMDEHWKKIERFEELKRECEEAPKSIKDFVFNKVANKTVKRNRIFIGSYGDVRLNDEQQYIALKAWMIANKETAKYIGNYNNIDDIVQMFISNFGSALFNIARSDDENYFLIEELFIGRENIEETRRELAEMIKARIG